MNLSNRRKAIYITISILLAFFIWFYVNNDEQVVLSIDEIPVEFLNEETSLADKGLIKLPFIPEHCTHNAHMFYLKVEDLQTRTALLKHLVYNGILAVFHYVPLHSSPAGLRYGRFSGEDKYTTNESNRLLRLPMFFGLKTEEIDFVCSKVNEFFGV